jgi:thiosulfate dehydrogenase (quinone) large subunit
VLKLQKASNKINLPATFYGMEQNKVNYIWGLLRLGMGWILFWAFIDKLFGLGFATCRDGKTGLVDILCEKAWLEGGSPASGFLTFATKGPFAGFYQGLAGSPIVDWLFMVGLFSIGIALLLGIGVKIASYSGVLMMLLMYAAGFIPPANNPFLDDHLIYAIVFAGLALSHSGRWLGLGAWWQNTPLVQKYKILE